MELQINFQNANRNQRIFYLYYLQEENKADTEKHATLLREDTYIHVTIPYSEWTHRLQTCANESKEKDIGITKYSTF